MRDSQRGPDAPALNSEPPTFADLPPLLTRAGLCALTGLSYTSIWKKMKKGEFPLGINVAPGSGQCIRWDTEEILDWWRDQRRAGRRQQLGYLTISQRAAREKRRGRKAGV